MSVPGLCLEAQRCAWAQSQPLEAEAEAEAEAVEVAEVVAEEVVAEGVAAVGEEAAGPRLRCPGPSPGRSGSKWVPAGTRLPAAAGR